MLEASPDRLKPILLCAFHTGMRKAEILHLTWECFDLKGGFIRLKEPDTKKSERRHIPIGRELRGVLERLLIVIDAHGHVFTRQGLPIKSMRESFKRVCRDSGFSDIVFDDLRHRAIPNLRRAGVDALTVMRITGHKTMAVFKRYNTIDEDNLTTAQHRMDTYMHTKALKRQGETL